MQQDSLPLGAMQGLSVSEADHAVQSLCPIPLEEVGSARWKEQRAAIENLNRTSHVNAAQKRDDFVIQYLDTHDKLTVIIHELLVSEVFRCQVLPPSLDDILRNPTGQYMYGGYYEGMLVNLLECIMYNESAVTAFPDDDINELIDYCWRQVVQYLLSSTPSSSSSSSSASTTTSSSSSPSAVPPASVLSLGVNDIDPILSDTRRAMSDDVSDTERYWRTQREANITRALACLSVLWFIIERLNDLPFSVTNNVLLKSDLVCGLVSVLEARPWLRMGKKSSNNSKDSSQGSGNKAKLSAITQKFVQGQWKEVSPSDSAVVCSPEAHCWFALHFLLCDRTARQKYSYTQYKKEHILRAKRHLNEIMIDQLPVLTQLQRAFEEMSFLQPPTGTEEKFKNTLVIEPVARIFSTVERTQRQIRDEIVPQFRRRVSDPSTQREDAMRLSALLDQMMMGFEEHSNLMISDESHSSSTIASLNQRISALTHLKRQWEAKTSEEALGPVVQALRDYAWVETARLHFSQKTQLHDEDSYASMLRTTASQSELIATLMQEDCVHRVKALFDEPMDELRREITAMREDFQRMLREDIVTSSPQHPVIPERLPTMCVLLETYAAVYGERMWLPPDVMEGIIPMVGREKSRVFYRAMTLHDLRARHNELLAVGLRHNIPLPDESISDEDLSSFLRRYNWCVIPATSPCGGLHSGVCGSAHFYDDAGDEQAFVFTRKHSGLIITMETTQEALVVSLVENVLSYLKRSG